jgi:DNA-binding CsgD family transcriptional regulator
MRRTGRLGRVVNPVGGLVHRPLVGRAGEIDAVVGLLEGAPPVARLERYWFLVRPRSARQRWPERLATASKATPMCGLTWAMYVGADQGWLLATIDQHVPLEPEAPPGLTAREREILAHIVAGLTYGEIARELVISEKTVSVHVSHLLHKTGTTNRVELAQLARRLAAQAN